MTVTSSIVSQILRGIGLVLVLLPAEASRALWRGTQDAGPTHVNEIWPGGRARESGKPLGVKKAGFPRCPSIVGVR